MGRTAISGITADPCSRKTPNPSRGSNGDSSPRVGTGTSSRAAAAWLNSAADDSWTSVSGSFGSGRQNARMPPGRTSTDYREVSVEVRPEMNVTPCDSGPQPVRVVPSGRV